jgi:hypothetical protein
MGVRIAIYPVAMAALVAVVAFCYFMVETFGPW